MRNDTRGSGVHKQYRYGPFYSRLVTPCLAVVVGIILAAANVDGLGNNPPHSAFVIFVVGVALMLVGIGGFFLALWMGKRWL